MEGQQRMFRLAPEAFTVSAHYVPAEGWTLALCVRRQAEQWSESTPNVYYALSTPELFDVLVADLAHALGV